MSKINILVLPSDRTGVGKYRSVDPHIYLQNNHSEEFHVDIDYEPKLDDDNYWKKYQIVHFHRVIGRNYEQSPLLIKKLNSMGIVTICDLDDYWLPGKEHPAYELVRKNNLDTHIKNNLSAAQYVTTTTKLFADEIRKINKNVFVLPNAIDPEEDQFKAETVKSDRLRFGWLGGSSHLHDLKLMEGVTNRLSEFKNEFQMYLCGFDTRGTVTEINPQTGEQKQRPIKPDETVWMRYEEFFTDNYKLVDTEHKSHLMKFIDEEYHNTDVFYNRVWTRPITTYAKNYSKFDVSLAPIKDTMFNRMKSQLKVIEAGFYKKALIASDIGPYTIDLTHALDKGEFTDGNALLVNKGRNSGDWSKYMKKLIKNPTWAEDLGERLYETVNGTYDLKTVTNNRAEFYKTLVK
jgi:glycosyltransferase involved in cell wall biosynthesis